MGKRVPKPKSHLFKANAARLRALKDFLNSLFIIILHLGALSTSIIRFFEGEMTLHSHHAQLKHWGMFEFWNHY